MRNERERGKERRKERERKGAIDRERKKEKNHAHGLNSFNSSNIKTVIMPTQRITLWKPEKPLCQFALGRLTLCRR